MSSSPTSSSSSDLPALAEALAVMHDVTCGVDFVIGSGHLTVRECLRLGRHSVVRLGEPVGGDLDVRVHGVSVAHGEVAVIDDSAALRITRITPPAGVGWE
jgi:flagellar motor switch/type III secretory pathway protein FliN